MTVHKRRVAAYACQRCRSRKVRCDVDDGGIPCTNCRLDCVGCQLAQRKKRRRAEPHTDQSLLLDFDSSRALEATLSTIQTKNWHHSLEMGAEIYPWQESNQGMPTPPSTTAEQFYTSHVNVDCYDECTTPESLMRHNTQANSCIRARGGTRYQPDAFSEGCGKLPSYIRQPQLASDELSYLQRRGAFDLPPTKIRNEMLRCYVEFVHPFLPVIDLQSFLAGIEGNGSQISLLLFQSVMFAGTGFIGIGHLEELGFVSRRAARLAFLEKCKVLHDLGCEFDRLALVASALLMTCWYDKPDEPKDIWHWSGISISAAQSLGLNLNNVRGEFDEPTRNLRKRLWWSCYMRDRLISLGMRRPFRIPNHQLGLSMLTLNDFEINIRIQTNLLPGCSLIEDPSVAVALARMCISFSQLCIMIRPILDLHYTLSSAKAGPATKTTALLTPKVWPQNQSSVDRLEGLLAKWCQVHGESTLRHSGNRSIPSVAVHRSTTLGLYWSLVTSLHRPQFMAARTQSMPLPSFSYQRMICAADAITKISKDLVTGDLIRYMPNTGVTILLSALVVYLTAFKSTAPNARQNRISSIGVCMRALQNMRPMCTSADFAYSLINRTMQSLNPELVRASSPNHDSPQYVFEHNTTTQMTESSPLDQPTPSTSNVGDVHSPSHLSHSLSRTTAKEWTTSSAEPLSAEEGVVQDTNLPYLRDKKAGSYGNAEVAQSSQMEELFPMDFGDLIDFSNCATSYLD